MRFRAWRTLAPGATETRGGTVVRRPDIKGGGGDALRLQELVLAHPVVVVQLREVALAGVAEDGDDRRVRIVELAREVRARPSR
jgi:hypothetical protein